MAAGVRFLLDTNTVSYHVRQSSAGLRRRLAAVPASSVALSVVTEMELRYGLARNPRLRVKPLVEEFLAGITVLPLTSEAAHRYGAIRADLEARGTPIGPLDLMIAAHALSVGVTLVTTNLQEFSRVPGLRCVDWAA